ncbi:MAG: DEAD/DEAH box helicase, partial [Proteobacteria bacterium]
DMEFILEKTAEDRQTIFFSATMSKPIMDLTKKFLNDPVLVKVATKELTVTNIDQYYLEIKRGMKTEVLSRIIDMYNLKLMLVFCNTKRMVDELVSDLQARGYSADALHGDLSQNQRNNVMTKFRNGTLEVLVATDVAARGIDVDNVEAVFNYDLPQDPEAYVHRIGRTGRAGRAGKAFSFVIGRDVYTLKDVQRYTKANIKLMPIPSFEDVATIKTNLFMEKVKEVARKGHLTKHIHRIEQMVDEEFTSIDIAAALLKMAVGELKAKEKSQEEVGRKAGPKPGMDRLFVTIGKKDKVSPKDIVNVIMEEAGLQEREIGDIELYDRFSFVEIPSELAAEVIRNLGRTQIRGKMVTFDKAQKKEEAQAAEEGFNRPERREKNRRFEPRGGGRSDRSERRDRPERRERRY